ncbi:MAG: hypothetical protein HGA53_05575, partial [Anaerolineaceae bacterium]|nr:hypothetical protein [Anaerolineaceae bacterium]
MKKRIFLVFTVIFSVLVLSACFDMTQEYTINPDGTGKFMFDQGISNSIAQMGGDTATLFSDLQKVDQEISANEGFKNVKSEQYTKDDMTRFKVTGEFLSLEALTTTFNSMNTGTPVTFKKLENGNYAYQQTISPSSLGTDSLGGSSSDPNSAEMLKSMFKDKFWTVRFTVPKIVNTNGKVQGASNTVEWKIPLADLMSGTEPIEMNLEFSLVGGGGSNSVLFILIGVGVALIALIVVVLIVARNKKPQPAYPPYPQQN